MARDVISVVDRLGVKTTVQATNVVHVRIYRDNNANRIYALTATTDLIFEENMPPYRASTDYMVWDNGSFAPYFYSCPVTYVHHMYELTDWMQVMHIDKMNRRNY